MKGLPKCRHKNCLVRPYLGGLCRDHYEEDEKKSRLRRDAIIALQSATVDDVGLTDNALKQELYQLQEWWFRAADVLKYGMTVDFMPSDEAQYAQEWCISLAIDIVQAERTARNGESALSDIHYTREWVWKRFAHLQAGKRSNGTELQ